MRLSPFVLGLAACATTHVGEVPQLRQGTPPERADEVTRGWLARDPAGLRAALEDAPLDTLCVVGAALERLGRADLLDAPRRNLVERCSRAGERPRGSRWTIAQMVVGSGIALRSVDLARTDAQIDGVLRGAVRIAASRRLDDDALARLLARGLLHHVELEDFLLDTGGRSLWIVALALEQPRADPTVRQLAAFLANRPARSMPDDELRALGRAFADRWQREGPFIEINDDVWGNGGQIVGPIVRVATWAEFVGVPELVFGHPPAAWQSLPHDRQAALAAESLDRRLRNVDDWARWLAAQRAALGLAD